MIDPSTKKPLPGTERFVSCDTLLLSVGLMPENELTRGAGVVMDSRSNGARVDETLGTSVPGIFSAGNVLHIHDLVDFVSEEGERAGRNAAAFITGGCQDIPKTGQVQVIPGAGLSYVVPQGISSSAEGDVIFRFRSRDVYRAATVTVYADGREIKHARRPIILPAEMESIIVPASACMGAEKVELCISTKEGD